MTLCTPFDIAPYTSTESGVNPERLRRASSAYFVDLLAARDSMLRMSVVPSSLSRGRNALGERVRHRDVDNHRARTAVQDEVGTLARLGCRVRYFSLYACHAAMLSGVFRMMSWRVMAGPC